MGNAKEALDFIKLQKIIDTRRNELGIKINPHNFGKWEHEYQRKKGKDIMKLLGY